jgi:hypothetical protein
LCLGIRGAAFSPATAYAHGAPIELAVWGAWGRRLARCQRIIARNAAACALRTWEARRACRLTTLSGGQCDQNATDQIIEAVRIEAVTNVGDACTDQQVQQLMFLNEQEAQLDVVSFCRELEDAVDSAVFLPGKDYLSFKLRSADVPEMPKPFPLFDSRLDTLDRIAQQSFRRRARRRWSRHRPRPSRPMPARWRRCSLPAVRTTSSSARTAATRSPSCR